VARIELVRSGGFAGLSLRTAADTSGSDPDGQWYAEELAGLDLPALAELPVGEPQPDRYHYALSVAADDGTTHRLEFAEPSLPEPLRPLVDRLVARAVRDRPTR
jgi:hypothetical protein